MSTPHELLAAPDRRRLWTAVADAVGIILLADAALSLTSGRLSIGWVFFHVATRQMRYVALLSQVRQEPLLKNYPV